MKKYPSNIVVAGINDTKSQMSSSSVVHIRSRYSGFSANVKCLVTDKVTAELPSSTVDIIDWEIPPGVQLADPLFYQSGKVDLLLGNQLFWKLLLPGEVQLADNLPCLRETRLGWVVGGVCNDEKYDPVVNSHSLTFDKLNRCVQKFWEVEEILSAAPPSEAEDCERHFQETHRRDETGRFIVQLPLDKDVAELSDSRSMALKRFYILERRFEQDPELKRQYAEFMEDYERLGHCEEIKEGDDPEGVIWYLPHHAILRPSNTTTEWYLMHPPK
ncbi:uncharacterized protein LOC134207070 [Armigeres subalbatus]|uniref:uncharacterized protein LOC134207070 n=1 Tax=Armigeres subalbatus TaxID=124917 RepID=UPI002ED25436